MKKKKRKRRRNEGTEKGEGRKNSVPVQKPTKGEGRGEGYWNILKDAFRLNAADEIVSSVKGERKKEGRRERKTNKTECKKNGK